jgi:hypothetical protein
MDFVRVCLKMFADRLIRERRLTGTQNLANRVARKLSVHRKHPHVDTAAGKGLILCDWI